MGNTSAFEVINSFESTFADKCVLPMELEIEWLKQAIARFSVELDRLNFDEAILEFDCKLDKYTIDTLASFMKQSYQERQVSLVNKRVSIVGKDLSWDGNGNGKTAERAHLEFVASKSNDMIANQKPTAYN